MKKTGVQMKSLAALSLALSLIAVSAAGAGLGLKGGMSYSLPARFGSAHAGFVSFSCLPPVGFLNVQLGGFSLQPEVYFTRIGMRLGTRSNFIDYRLEYIQVPILFKLDLLSGRIRPVVFAGPYGSSKLQAKGLINTRDLQRANEFSNEINTRDRGVVIGAGVDCRISDVRLFLDARYEHGLATPLANPMAGATDHNRSLKVLVGVGF
jgi:hypothetical protein